MLSKKIIKAKLLIKRKCLLTIKIGRCYLTLNFKMTSYSSAINAHMILQYQLNND